MKYKVYSNLFNLALGLRFHKKLKKDEVIVFKLKEERDLRLSMNFVFFPITALWINKDNIITHVEKLQPFTYSQKKKALYIAEMSLTNKYKKGQKFKIK